jgi:hypothetical protein
MTGSPPVHQMRPSATHFIAFILSLPAWVVIFVCILYRNYLGDFGVPLFIFLGVACTSYFLSVTLSLCLPDFSRRDTKLLLIWEAVPFLACVIWGFMIFVEKIPDIGDWIFMAMMWCINKMLFGNG